MVVFNKDVDKSLDCFHLNNEYLGIEKVLFEDEFTPLIFLCKGRISEDLFVALNTYPYNEIYYLIKVSDDELKEFLKNPVSNFTEIFISKEKYFEIHSGKMMKYDKVFEKSTSEVDFSQLPKR